jgi:hypothetical protein
MEVTEEYQGRGIWRESLHRRPFSNNTKQQSAWGGGNKFAVSVTVHRWHNNINSQLVATITNFIDNYNQFNMIREIISPILRNTRVLYSAPAMLPAGSFVRALLHSLLFLRVGEIIARNMLS